MQSYIKWVITTIPLDDNGHWYEDLWNSTTESFLFDDKSNNNAESQLCGAIDPTAQGDGAIDPTVQGDGAIDPTVQGDGAIDPVAQGDGAIDPTVQGVEPLIPQYKGWSH